MTCRSRLPSGALSAYLARLASGRAYQQARDISKKISAYGKQVDRCQSRALSNMRVVLSPAARCLKNWDFYHIGPIDGHDFAHLLPVLRNVRDNAEGPVLIHVVTQKGKGYAPAEAAADKCHGVNNFDVMTGVQAKPPSNAPSYTKVFGESLVIEAERDDRIVGVTAAMPAGTGLDLLARPSRTPV